jgi:phospholipid/cholesterol/gamma-HCH transport system ATP-binding protein
MPEESMIKLENISKSFGDRLILDDISLSVGEHEILAIIGPSGCGKSTLLRVISGLESPDSGKVCLADDNITMVFQYSALFDSLTVFENVAFSLMEHPDFGNGHKPLPMLSETEMHRIVKEKLALVGLENIQDLYPSQLSGGMQKRVSFARAIVSDPAIILYDEPTAGLDPIASTLIEDYIDRVRVQTQATSVVVTHNISTIKRVADWVCLLFDGKIQWQGTSKEFFKTDNAYARQFSEASLEGPMTHHLG